MMPEYKGAKYYKCALQVNPASYAAFRGHSVQDEGVYNAAILQQCQQRDIKVVGIANHGNIDSSEGLREYLSQNGIVVFPGFEIRSSERVHFVCLFPENTTRDQLMVCLAKLEVSDQDATKLSTLSAAQIFVQVANMDGIVYAAHCTHANGVLKAKQDNIWKDDNLMVAQIPGAKEDSKQAEGGMFFYDVLCNKDANYKRNKPMALINAKDVEMPEDLAEQAASCRIKMTEPNFAAFKQAFYDADSRVRLNHEIAERHYSYIESIQWSGAGFFEDASLALSRNLNTIIGGRGTGKTTLIESIRFVLDLPVGSDKSKEMDLLRKRTLANSQVVLAVLSKAQNGQRYTISRRYGEAPVVKNSDGEVSNFAPSEILPEIEILGQNEILEMERDEGKKLSLLHGFMESNGQFDERISEAQSKLKSNREKILQAEKAFEGIESIVSQKSKLEERLKQFEALGVVDKLKDVKFVEKEKAVKQRCEDQFSRVAKWLDDYQSVFDLTFLDEGNIQGLPNKAIVAEVRAALEQLQLSLNQLVAQAKASLKEGLSAYEQAVGKWDERTEAITNELEKAIAQLPNQSGKSGKDLGKEYASIVEQLSRISKISQSHEQHKALIDQLRQERGGLFEQYRELAFNRFTNAQNEAKQLNSMLKGKMKISVRRCGNKEFLKDFLLQIPGVGSAAVEWLDDEDSLDLWQWASWIQASNPEAFVAAHSKAGMPTSFAKKLVALDLSKQLELMEVELNDSVDIELNVAHGDKEHYVPLHNLSTGQKCTAILNLILLNRDDPLIIDQPEDNLDNAFIADRIVSDLRKEKTKRQFVLASHNANIPVFGDAELIVVLEGKNSNKGHIAEVGSIDKMEIKQYAAGILEGGETAFNIRKDKYGF